MSHPAFTFQLQSITALWSVLISRPDEGTRLSWPGCVWSHFLLKLDITWNVCCVRITTSSGLLLHPSRPATATDVQMLQVLTYWVTG